MGLLVEESVMMTIQDDVMTSNNDKKDGMELLWEELFNVAPHIAELSKRYEKEGKPDGKHANKKQTERAGKEGKG